MSQFSIFKKAILYLLLLDLTEILAQTTCNNGNGRVLYERLPNQQLQGFDDDVVRDTAPPFRVLEKCQDLCLRDRTASNNLVRTCTSFDFQPGSRIASFSGSAEYEESTCYLTREQAAPEGIGNLMLVPNSVHFTEVCLSSNRPERECPSRRYVFERHPRKKLKLPLSDIKELTAANRSDCEDKCLNEFSFVCRSANFDSTLRTCSLSRFTRRTHPELLEDDPNSDYLENTCLNAERRCDGLAVFVKEENKRLGGPFEVDIFNNMTLEECQTMCLRAEKYFCRSVEFDDQTKQCILSEEDSISQKDDISISSSPTHHFYDLVCLDNQRGTDYPDNSVTSHLFSSGRRPDTAFQRYRNSRLGGEFHSEITGRSLSECLDECLRQTSFQCRSAVYSDRFRTCRLSRYNQRDGMRIIYDADYDYYENLMLNVVGSEGHDERPPSRPDMNTGTGPDWRPPNDNNRFPNRHPDDRYPSSEGRFPFDGNRYPPNYDNGGRYPPGPDGGRYPPGNDAGRYPPGNDGGRYPPGSEGGRYPPGSEGGRYPPPVGEGGRYPPGTDSGRYPPPSDGGRYPPGDNKYTPARFPPPRDPGRFPPFYPPTDTRYPPTEEKYPPFVGGKYPAGPNGRYPLEEIYPPSGYDRYPAKPPPTDYDFYRGHPYYDLEYDERPYSLGRPDYSNYDREYDSGFNRRPIGGMGYPPYEPPPYRPGIADGYNGISGGASAGVGGSRPPPPIPSRCDDFDNFKQVAARHKMRRQFIRRSLIAASLAQCQRECADARDFICRSFNYRDTAGLTYDERDSPNCELSDRDSRELDIHNPTLFDSGNYDFYERGLGRSDGECLDVSQTCNEEGMEFTLRTPEGFVGRIYTYGFYDRCFFRGNGGTVNVLRISGPQGYPECGTQRYGDTLTNIVVVQFSDNVQTGRDKRYNLTCIFRGPGEAVVTSGYIGAGLYNPDRSGSPIPIEYLPAENTLSSKVRLMILYQNRPTTTIAVGDPLTFRLEAQDGYNHVTDIFATNVVARDPYSGRSIQLIDRFGCPVDPYVFPELDKLRDGDTLEARFNAFKIPESNFLVFEATVRTCRDGCQPAYCPGPSGRSEPSFGRKRRSINETEYIEDATNSTTELITNTEKNDTKIIENSDGNSPDEAEQVREMIEVFESREEIEHESYARKLIAPKEQVCMTDNEYYGLISAVIMLMFLLFTITLISGLAYRKYWIIISKNRSVDRSSPSSFSPSTLRTHERFSEIGNLNTNRNNQFRGNMSLFGSGLQKTFATGNLARMCQIPVNSLRKNISNAQFDDPSEPIYTDPSLFERSRSLRSLTERNDNHDL
ncbi:uncharacterized protein LOC129610746 isoform X3 [Condylostylus longicornis]|uniref:uncharacterized protein LOC129610746 isoform X3 n=1 Tax=Condylostylus longicornis TaxID=2530218 RepID=UPI00244DFE62|nr:uncharacterized protein LOC129610746 isoform X3 [Condylostylus longicornis]